MKIDTKAALAVALIAFASLAAAQQYKWTDKNGKVQYGDFPPPGVKATPLKAPPGPATQPAPPPSKDGKDAKDAKKGPLTPAEQEQAFRQRQAEAKKAQEKAEKDAQASAERKENCARAQDAVRTFESGGRITKVAPNGERVFLGDEERAAELAKARKAAAEQCK